MNLPTDGSQCSHITSEDFDEDVWDVLCAARILYVRKVDMGTWYRALREFCGYRGNGVWVKRRMALITDEWLRTHPSWAATYEAKASQLTKEYFR